VNVCSINAGLDQEGGGTSAIKALPRAIADKLVNSSSITTSFKRLFRIRILLGMLDPPTLNPYNFITNGTEVVESQRHLELARVAAQKAICLYKNDNDVLPLSPLKYKRIALIGPQVIMTNLLLGNYAERPDAGIVSILDGFTHALNNTDSTLKWKTGCLTIACESSALFADAIEAAREADVVVVTLGLDQNMESEGNDRSSIDLPANQYALVNAIRAAIGSKPMIGILIHGGTIAMKSLTLELTAIIDAWYPGMQGGNGIADVVFGKVSPAGRASVTYYQDTAQLPPMGNMDLYAINGTTYRYFQVCVGGCIVVDVDAYTC
jgi:beta-glucosidase